MWAIGIHGGAGRRGGAPPGPQQAALEAALAWAESELARGGAALDVVEGAIRRLEDSGQFLAGRGSSPNSEGEFELDASICDGATRRAGAVAALAGAWPPISIARAVMERTPHVLLAGAGARRFALAAGFAAIDSPATFFAPIPSAREDDAEAPHGTVGAVALDARGAIAAGTSTGGIRGKLPGRVGDSPIVGAGSWADASVGVSCTGQGEFFLRASAAHAVAVRWQEAPDALAAALERTLADVAALGGRGGMVAVDRLGRVEFAFNADAMWVAVADARGLRRAMAALRPSAP